MSDCKLQLGCLCVVGYLALVYCRERRHAARPGSRRSTLSQIPDFFALPP